MVDKNLSQGSELESASKGGRKETPVSPAKPDSPPTNVFKEASRQITREILSTMKVDLGYAIKQLRDVKDITRATDALDRVMKRLLEAENYNFPP